jgi:hypothetical protein
MADYSKSVSDTTTTSEHIVLFSPLFITISDTTVTSDNTDIMRASTRDVSVSDTSVTSELINDSTVLLPAWIVRTLSFEVVIPSSINFVLITAIPIADFVMAKT